MTGTRINLKLDKICRGCLSEEGNMTAVFHNDTEPDILKMFESCTSLQIQEDDGFPTQMCNTCIARLHESYQFRQMCVQSNFTVRALQMKSEFVTESNATEDSSDIEQIDNSELCSIEIEEKEGVDDKECDFLNLNVDNCKEPKVEIIENEMNNYQCGTCLESFNTFKDLKQHEFDWHVAVRICAVCNKTFSSADDLMSHSCKNVANKTGIRKYRCKECDKEYTSSHNLQIHIYSHSGFKPFSCEQCGKSFTKVSSLNSHISLHTGYLSYLCSECGKGFSTSTGLKRHKISHSGERPHKCKLCPAGFAASGDLNVHMRSHTGEKPYLCPTCGKAFSRISHLNTHARTHTGEKPYKCSRCDKAFAQSGDLKSHERTHTGEKPYACQVCKKRFIQSSGLASHMRTHTGEKSYRCSICYKAFSQPSSLMRHRRCHNE